MCQNLSCGQEVRLDEVAEDTERYTVLSTSLLHFIERLVRCNFGAGKNGIPLKHLERGGMIDDPLTTSLDDSSAEYCLSHDMRYHTGKKATTAFGEKAFSCCANTNGDSSKDGVCTNE